MSLGRSEDTSGANASMSASRSGVAPDSSAASRADSDSSYLRRVYSSANSIDTTDRLLTASVIRRSEEHTSELQSLMRISYAVFCLKKKTEQLTPNIHTLKHTTLII